jgi:hypothetical protein
MIKVVDKDRATFKLEFLNRLRVKVKVENRVKNKVRDRIRL